MKLYELTCGNEQNRNLKHALRQSFTERPPHTSAGERARTLQDAANLRLAAGLDKAGAVELKQLCRKKLASLGPGSP